MSDEELIEEIRRVYRLAGRDVLTVRDFNRLSVTRYDMVRGRFSGWHEALDRAGIAKSDAGKRYTEEQCFENIAALWTHYGRQPKYAELKKPPSTVGPKAYIGARWGSWRKALKAFVDWANAEEPDGSEGRTSVESVTSLCPASESPMQQEDRHDIPLHLKFKVLKRDRFRCRACGRSPAKNDPVDLHVDHIEPWADGGKTVIENLQALCQDCNLGKGRSFAKVE
jgi:hypothetical protein